MMLIKRFCVYATLISFFLSGNLFGQPANDLCTDADTVIIPANGTICLTGNSIGATTSGELHNCKTSSVKEVWFTFVATGIQNTVVVTPSGSSPIGSPVITVSNDGCSRLATDACGSYSGGSTSASAGYSPGTRVWVDVGGLSMDGEFDICITSENPPLVQGNACETAILITSKDTFSVDNLTDISSSGITPSCFARAVSQDIWYQFTVESSGKMEWSCDPHGNNVELDWAMYDITDGCPNIQDPADIAAKEVACNYNYSGPGNADPIGMADSVFNGLNWEPTNLCPQNQVTNQYGREFCPPFESIACRTYAIIIDNSDANGVGHDFSWGGDFTIKANPQDTCIVGLDDLQLNEEEMIIFPNPTNHLLSIRYHFDQTSSVNLELINTIGQLSSLYNSSNQAPGDWNYSIPVSNFAKGVYFVRLLVNGKQLLKKIQIY